MTPSTTELSFNTVGAIF